jgi:hypothetical protein
VERTNERSYTKQNRERMNIDTRGVHIEGWRRMHKAL